MASQRFSSFAFRKVPSKKIAFNEDFLVLKDPKSAKNYSTQYSHVVSHHSTNCASTSLTSGIGRDPVCSSVYGRSWRRALKTCIYHSTDFFLVFARVWSWKDRLRLLFRCAYGADFFFKKQGLQCSNQPFLFSPSCAAQRSLRIWGSLKLPKVPFLVSSIA